MLLDIDSRETEHSEFGVTRPDRTVGVDLLSGRLASLTSDHFSPQQS